MQKVRLPKFPVAGGCQCGNIKYKLNAPPSVFYLCHCTQCQRQSSSAFGQSMRVRLEDVEVTGKMARFTRKGTASGSPLLGDFCPDCGVRLIHRRDAYGTEASLKAGSLDDTSWLVPAGHIWTRSKQKWVTIPRDSLAYEAQPEDFGALKERWREMIA
jgi:hypothetical protein